jgi:hypothetical protein
MDLEDGEVHGGTVGGYLFFGGLAPAALHDLMNAAHLLGAARLLDDACEFVAGRLRGLRDPERIRQVLGAPMDVTPARTAEVLARMSWATSPGGGGGDGVHPPA